MTSAGPGWRPALSPIPAAGPARSLRSSRLRTNRELSLLSSHGMDPGLTAGSGRATVAHKQPFEVVRPAHWNRLGRFPERWPQPRASARKLEHEPVEGRRFRGADARIRGPLHYEGKASEGRASLRGYLRPCSAGNRGARQTQHWTLLAACARAGVPVRLGSIGRSRCGGAEPCSPPPHDIVAKQLHPGQRQRTDADGVGGFVPSRASRPPLLRG